MSTATPPVSPSSGLNLPLARVAAATPTLVPAKSTVISPGL